jgi:hypothetical protein
MARSYRSSCFTGALALASIFFCAARDARAQQPAPQPAPQRPAPQPAPPRPAGAPAAVSPAPPDLPPPPPPPWTANPNAAAQGQPPSPPPDQTAPAQGAAPGVAPAAPTPTSTFDPEQERRLGLLELHVRQLEEQHRRDMEEHEEWWGWMKHVHFSGYLQPQMLWSFYNDAASPNVVNGSLPSGVSANDVTAKQDTVFGPGAPGVSTNKSYFRLRRARLKIELEPNEYSRMVVEIDPTLAGGPDNGTGTIARNVEADGLAKWGGGVETLFGMGIFKIPYGWEVLQSDADRPFIERSWWEQNVIPGEFDTGAKAYTRAMDGRLVFQAAFINGQTMGEKTFSLVPDLTKGKSIVGRASYNFGPFDVGTSGYYGQGAEVSLAQLAFKQFPRWAWNFEAALHHRFLPFGATRVLGEFNLGQNMDRGVNYAFALPGLPSDIVNGSVTNRNELGGFIRIEQDITHWSTLAVRYDYYTPDTSISDDGRHTFAVVGVAHFTRQLQLMLEYNHFIDNVRASSSAPEPNKLGDVLSTVFQVRYP